MGIAPVLARILHPLRNRAELENRDSWMRRRSWKTWRKQLAELIRLGTRPDPAAQRHWYSMSSVVRQPNPPLPQARSNAYFASLMADS
jgi:hypothetical protein